MSKLVRPREITERKRSQLKDSNSKRAELRAVMARLVGTPEYLQLKKLAVAIASQYRPAPGRTPQEDAAFLTHCKVLWAYNTLWTSVEQIARTPQGGKEQNVDDGW